MLRIGHGKQAIGLAILIGAGSAGAMGLGEAIEAVRKVDPMVAREAANRDATQESMALAKARLLPQVSFQGSHQNTRQHTDRGLGSSLFEGKARSAALSVRQALFRPKDAAGIELARVQAAFGDASLSATQSEMWGRATNAWLDLVMAARVVDLSERVVVSAEAEFAQQRSRLARGEGTKDQTAESEAQVHVAKAQRADAQASLLAKRKHLELLTRQPAASALGLHLPDLRKLPTLPLDLESLIEQVLRSNPELEASRLNEQAAGIKLRQATLEHVPTVDFVGSKSEGQNDSSNNLGSRYRSLQFGIQVTVPIYQGGAISAGERQAAAWAVAAAAERDATEQRLRSQVSTDFLALEGAWERVRGLDKLLDAARESMRAAELGVTAGIRTRGDVEAARQTMVRRELDVLNAKAAVLRLQAKLLALLPVGDSQIETWVSAVDRAVQPGR